VVSEQYASTRTISTMGPSSVEERLAALAPDQRAAATAPPGPVLCVAPAGSGKTTTLVARVAWLVAGGADPAGITAITFNRRAAEELEARIGPAIAPLLGSTGEAAAGGSAVRVRTFHALGREILADAGVAVDRLVDRAAVLGRLFPAARPARLRVFDDAFSRFKLDLRVLSADVAADPEAGPIGRAFLAYENALAAAGQLDFDDLVARTLGALEADIALLERWRGRCRELLVDEAQDVDRSQLRLALLLAAPGNRIFLVGDDDQSIYGWRLADVRRILDIGALLPGVRRVDLETNYRCPGPVVERAVRLVAVNEERFVKRIRARTDATGRLVLAPDDREDVERVRRVVEGWSDDDSTRAVLARTNRELLPALVVALERAIPFRAERLVSPLEDRRLGALLDGVAAVDQRLPLLVRIARAAARTGSAAVGEPPGSGEGRPEAVGERAADRDPDREAGDLVAGDLVAAVLGWAASFRDLPTLRAAVEAAAERLASLRRDDARLTLATVHSTKGLEFDHVVVLGMDDGRFPSARSIADAADPARQLEEERRLAYVAWTRARRSLTLSYDPGAPSGFLREAFSAEELGLDADRAAVA
jgi:DNA helicase II / ATP-dependent DNA helicase PcrA